jgi:LPS sulfotransferase NodH
VPTTDLAGSPESPFRSPDHHTWAARWQLTRDHTGAFDYGELVRVAVADGSTAYGVFGGRIMWGALDDRVARYGATASRWSVVSESS